MMDKPGYKTSEFWTALAACLISFANQSGFLGTQLDVNTIMFVLSPAITYILTRSVGKTVAQVVGAKPVDPKTLNQ